MPTANRRIVLRARPAGIAGPEHFAEQSAPIRGPGPGEVLLETLYLSVDPAMRVWISEDPGYVRRVEPGEVMRSTGIARVMQSAAPELSAGDLVQGMLGWQSHPTLRADSLERFDVSPGQVLDRLGVLGIPGLTAYVGMRIVGGVRPGETVLVSGAAGAVGQIAAQIGRIEGCRVVGIAGGADKCAWLTGELGLAAAIDRHAEPDPGAALRAAAPEAFDLYFDNVGGPTLDAALAQLRQGGRVVICGRISQTAAPEPYGVRNIGLLIGRRARMEGFIATDHAARYPEARAWLSARLADGSLRHRTHVLEGLERAPEGLAMLFRGENLGKLVVRVAG